MSYVIIRGGVAQDYSDDVDVFDLDVFDADFTDQTDLEYVRDNIWDRIDLLPEDYQEDFRAECVDFIDSRMDLLPGYSTPEQFLNNEEPSE